MRLLFLTESIDRKDAANVRVGNGIIAQGDKSLACAGAVLSCTATCTPDPVLCGLCKTCF